MTFSTRMFLRVLRPDYSYESLYHIGPEDLKTKGLKGLIVDLDGTTLEYGGAFLSHEREAWFFSLLHSGIKICLVSNNASARVKNISDCLRVPCVSNAMKPLKRAFRKGLEALDLPASQVAVVGDQILTDVWGGNRAGLITILVPPLGYREHWWSRIIRRVERPFRRSLSP
jgi:HAD superfamily phosphatase (TIGR01668 family)